MQICATYDFTVKATLSFAFLQKYLASARAMHTYTPYYHFREHSKCQQCDLRGSHIKTPAKTAQFPLPILFLPSQNALNPCIIKPSPQYSTPLSLPAPAQPYYPNAPAHTAPSYPHPKTAAPAPSDYTPPHKTATVSSPALRNSDLNTELVNRLVAVVR